MATYNQGQKLSTEDIELYLHRVWTSDGYKNEPNQMMHVDTFHSSTKVVYLDDVSEDEGQQLSSKQLYDSWRLGFSLSIYKNNVLGHGALRIQNGKIWFTKEFIVKENTCVIADTIGFHRRGDAKQGIKRDSIFFSVENHHFNNILKNIGIMYGVGYGEYKVLKNCLDSIYRLKTTMIMVLFQMEFVT